MDQKLLVPTDFSDAAALGVRAAGELAQQLGASITLVHVWNPEGVGAPPATLGWSHAQQEHLLDEVRAHLSTRLDDGRELLPEGVEIDTVLLEDHSAARAITDYARHEGYDLIVVSTHGRTGVGRFLLGSVTEKIVRLSRTRVLTVPAHPE
ncbi:MAG: universal stress protein [Myxococcales bacterium]|nr:universal stress protein [Myxococcales bacterium]